MKGFPGLRVPLVLGRNGDFLIKSLSKDQLDPKHWELWRGDQEQLFGPTELGDPYDYDKEYISLIHHDPKSGTWNGMLLVMARSEFNQSKLERTHAEQVALRASKESGWGDVLQVWGVTGEQLSNAEGEAGTEVETGETNPVRYSVKIRGSNGRIHAGGEGAGLGGLWVKLERQLLEREQAQAVVQVNLLPSEPDLFGG